MSTTSPIKLPPPPRGNAQRKRASEPVAKSCSTCERNLTICSFNLKTRTPWRRRHDCRECQAASSRAAYERNRESVIAKSRISHIAQVQKARSWIASHLADKRCADCNEAAPDIFEFDHRHGAKRASVSRMIQQGLSLAAIKAEVDKCDVLCPNCHRLRTHADQASYLHRNHVGLPVAHVDADTWQSPSGSPHVASGRHSIRSLQRNRIDNIAYLEEHPCVDCGADDIRMLEYDHVRGEKAADLSSLIAGRVSLARIAAERAKCDVRCCNCHRRRSHNVRPVAAAAA